MQSSVRSGYFHVIIFLTVIYVFLFPCNVFAEQIDLVTLGQNVAKTLYDLQVKTVAVTEFSSIDGSTSAGGKLIAEEITIGLLKDKKINVIERAVIEKAMQKQNVQQADLFDKKTVTGLGKFLGAEAIILGTWADRGDSIRVNTRIISVVTGNVLSASTVSVNRAEYIKLLETTSQVQSTLNQKKNVKAGTVFFREDFSRVAIGEVPAGWMGAENVLVNEIGDKRKKKVLTTFQRGPVDLHISNVKFPENFRLRWIVSAKRERGTIKTQAIIGNLKAGVHPRGHVFINKSETTKNNNTRITVELKEFMIEKKGQVFRLLIDGTEELIVRYPEFIVNDSFIISLCDIQYGRDNDAVEGNLYLIEGIDLGD